MADIFISYAREDEELAHRLARILEAHGYNLWWDTHMSAGSDVQQAIERELDDARCVLVLWSSNSQQSHWVRDEAQRGLDRGVLVPVSLDGTKPPLGFRTINTLDASGWEGSAYEQPIKDLLSAISAKIGELTAEEQLARRTKPKRSMFYHEPPTEPAYYKFPDGSDRTVLRDITEKIEEKVAALPQDHAPERVLLSQAERLFRRPAF